jgi:hypothetical protein
MDDQALDELSEVSVSVSDSELGGWTTPRTLSPEEVAAMGSRGWSATQLTAAAPVGNSATKAPLRCTSYTLTVPD